MKETPHKIIILKDLVKKFKLGHGAVNGFLQKFIHYVSGRESKKELEVIKGISLEIDRGEVVGLIGKNGSGKSTLLRILAGIYKEESGSVAVDGKAIYINGFNHGIKPRLTMYENIFLVGAIMGLSRVQVQQVFVQIIDFSGLQNFVNTKVYQFSSGMVARLQFSLFVHFVQIIKPEILLIDEALEAGGDIDFSKKASEEMRRLIQNGLTVLLVSHHLKEIEEYCSRVIWIEQGFVKENGPTSGVLEKYKQYKQPK